MNRKVIFGISIVLAYLNALAIDIKDINVRDPYIYVNTDDHMYYLYRSKSPAWDVGAERGGVQVFKSKDLKTWSEPKQVLEIPEDNWATGTIWAPEMHKINDKYYMFATVNDTITWKKKIKGHNDFCMRGTQIFVADNPEGPFLAYPERLPATPIGQMCLDGTYYKEGDHNYMIYCHEWVELTDGTVEMIELDSDMKPISNPIRLFCGSAPDWSTGHLQGAPGGDPTIPTYVTDGVFIHKSKTSGNLYMIWSSFCNGEYALGVARSKTGKITGPWIQIPDPIFKQDGGHGMIFTDFDGNLRLIFHGPNNPEGAERARIYTIYDDGNTLILND